MFLPAVSLIKVLCCCIRQDSPIMQCNAQGDRIIIKLQDFGIPIPDLSSRIRIICVNLFLGTVYSCLVVVVIVFRRFPGNRSSVKFNILICIDIVV